MKQNKIQAIGYILLSLIIYFFCTAVLMMIFNRILGVDAKTYNIRATFTYICCLPIMLGMLHWSRKKTGEKFYAKYDEPYRAWNDDMVRTNAENVGQRKVTEAKTVGNKATGNKAARWIQMILLVLAASYVMNNLVLYTGLSEISESYQSVSTEFYSGSIIWMVVDSVILAPILEEILNRGIIYQQLRSSMRVGIAAIISAVIFGALHMNIVQFIYAGTMGLLLCLAIEYIGSLRAAMVCHILMNGFAVVRTVVPIFRVWEQSTVVVVAGTVVAVVLALVMRAKIFNQRKISG